MVTNPTAYLRSENARLKAENQQLQDELRDLKEFVAILDRLVIRAKNIQDDSELLPLLNEILSQALELLKAPEGSLALYDADAHELVFVLVHGQLAPNLQGFRLSADEGIAGWVLNNAEPALVRDVRRDTRFFADVDERFKFNTLSIAAAPLVGDGKVLGVIEALNQPGDDPFSDTDMALLKLLCRFAGEALADIERRKPEGDSV